MKQPQQMLYSCLSCHHCRRYGRGSAHHYCAAMWRDVNAASKPCPLYVLYVRITDRLPFDEQPRDLMPDELL